MQDHFGDRERVVVAICGLAFVIAILFVVNMFARDLVVISALSIVVLFGSIFGELRDTWNSGRQFSPVRVFFRTFEWLSLAVAGYIILSVIGSNTITAT
jgi:hypothetical protein